VARRSLSPLRASVEGLEKCWALANEKWNKEWENSIKMYCHFHFVCTILMKNMKNVLYKEW